MMDIFPGNLHHDIYIYTYKCVYILVNVVAAEDKS